MCATYMLQALYFIRRYERDRFKTNYRTVCSAQSNYHADSSPQATNRFFFFFKNRVGYQGHIPAKTEKQLYLTGTEQPKQQTMLLNC